MHMQVHNQFRSHKSFLFLLQYVHCYFDGGIITFFSISLTMKEGAVFVYSHFPLENAKALWFLETFRELWYTLSIDKMTCL
jgi:hypothetical protein